MYILLLRNRRVRCAEGWELLAPIEHADAQWHLPDGIRRIDVQHLPFPGAPGTDRRVVDDVAWCDVGRSNALPSVKAWSRETPFQIQLSM